MATSIAILSIECRILFIVILIVIVLDVVVLSVEGPNE
jgi:hypothetical protein